MFFFETEDGLSGAPLSDEDEREVSMNRYGSNSSSGFDHEERPRYGGRDTDRFFGGSFEGDESDDDVDGVDDEPPSELVPLGMRGGSGSSSVRSPRNRTRSGSHLHKPGFYDFYKLTDEKLGAGAYASVRTCVSIASGKEYAVKVVDKNEESHTRSRILREVNTFKMCKNQPNIVQLIEWFEDDVNFYMVFEKMRGGPLLEHIIRKGYFTEEEARRVTVDIATALKFLHDRGIAHRDVKPENILCTEPDRVSPVKLCDLDLASRPVKGRSPPKLSQIASEPDLASPVGSAEFMAPEVVDAFVNDALRYDKRCDMWSLGVILYIMLCGYAPFQGECDDEDCGWSEGQPCDDCQQELFRRIQCGEYDFPSDEWDMISAEAKHLVSSLLVKNVSERLTANEVLDHPWVKQSAPSTILQTPSNLFRIDSARDVQQMSEHFNVMNRLVAARLSSRLDKTRISEDDWEVTSDSFSSASPTEPPPNMNSSDHQVPQTLPLFMMPPQAFMDPFSGVMVYPPGSEPPSPAGKVKERNKAKKLDSSSTDGSEFEITDGVQDSSCLNTHSSVNGIRRYIASVSRVPTPETCQGAVVRQESKSDLLSQPHREAEVNV
ncbi:MAP kinase-interacting serine/threonine-protein kinase mnk-1 [Parelaphostrongylus tenuis]|uniref:MAP kinase-interacting serine/threonine-protein kinase mnk-1 n=1 Tax=Parelaphostrongylus tenuis TaxID=148309 RepID=A0AAD5RAF3_PARTN|nr:MAP kinase-interacting serine/threonine-protein kinase mnk-1 [Parelaphostrongylus tenuis]